MDFDHDLGLLTSNQSGTIIIGGTAGLQIPGGMTAQRAVSPGAGSLRVNTTTNRLEFFLNSTWNNFGSGDVTSVALTLPGIFAVTGSPITGAGTLSATLVSQNSNTVLAGPAGSAGVPSFRQLAISNLSDVNTAGATSTNLLAFNGTTWVPSPVANGSASGTLSSWTNIGGNPVRFTQPFTHNLGTFAVVVSLFDTVTNQMVLPDQLQLTDANTVLVTISSGTRSLRIVVVANGQAIAAGGSTPSSVIVQSGGSPLGSFTAVNFTGGFTSVVNSGGGVATVTAPAAVANAGSTPSIQQGTLASRPVAGTAGRLFITTDTNTLFRDSGSAWVPLTIGAIRTLTYVAASLDSPNNSDWIVNALAPTTADPLAASLTVRSFSQTTEQGVGLLLTPPVNATTVSITFRARPQTAPGATAVVQPRWYRRTFPNAAAGSGWGAAVELNNITVPTTTNFAYTTQTYSLAALGLVAGQMALVELTRRTVGVTGGTNLASPWLLAELQLEYF